MKVVNKYPPNWQEIKTSLDYTNTTIFAYGDTIYNPFNVEIPEDIHFHETIHQQQQQNNPDWWWKRYLIDKDFRLEQELEAYTEQCKYVKNLYGNKGFKDCLEECATNLSSSLYGNIATKAQAETLIRHRVNGR